MSTLQCATCHVCEMKCHPSSSYLTAFVFPHAKGVSISFFARYFNFIDAMARPLNARLAIDGGQKKESKSPFRRIDMFVFGVLKMLITYYPLL